MKKIVIAWVASVLGLVILFAWMGSGFLPRSSTADDFGSGEALVTGGFTLVDAQGKTVHGSDFRGRYMLVYFGFTHCPDICPTTLLLMRNALEQLGDTAKKIQPIFITIDPERDSPKLVGTYAANFSKSILGLSGTPAQIKDAADHFKVYYSKVEDKKSALGYIVDHSGFIYLIGPDGKYVTHFAANVTEQELTKGLQHDIR